MTLSRAGTWRDEVARVVAAAAVVDMAGPGISSSRASRAP